MLRVLSLLVFLLVPFRLAGAASVQVLPPVTQADGRLGLDDVLPGAPPGSPVTWAQLAYDAGARVDRWELRWDRIEPAAGQYDFSSDDAAVQAATQAGLQVLGILIGTPAWATAAGQKPGNGVPRGLDLPYTDPNNLWADYIRAVVSQYQGQVSAWEVWNEPDLSFFWSGTPQQYFQLLKVAYLTIKSVDPSALVVVGGMVDPGMSFVSGVLSADAADSESAANNGYFDVAAWHAYGPASQLYTNLVHFSNLLAANGFQHVPIWVTEDGFPASNPNGEPRQAAYVLQTIAYAFAAGAARVLVYRASDDTTTKMWGVMASDGTPRMAYVSFQVAAKYLTGIDAGAYEPEPPDELLSLYAQNTRVVAIWDREVQPNQIQLPADSTTAQLVDWQGGTTTLSAQNGTFSVSVPGASYNAGIDPSGTVVGGPPLLLIESDPEVVGLGTRAHIPPISGTSRRLTLFNDGATPETVEVTPGDVPQERDTVTVHAHSVRTIDLDLLAGSSYAGFYNVASSAPVSSAAVAETTYQNAVSGADTWYLASGSPVTISNPASSGVTVTVEAFGKKGRLRTQNDLQVPSDGTLSWSVPADFADTPLAIEIRSPSPVIVSGDPGQSTATPQKAWYAVRPRATLTVFNPSNRMSRLDVRLLGSHGPPHESLRLGGHRLAFISPRGARAVVLSAGRPVVVGGTGTTNLAPSPVAGTTRASAVALAGPVTSLYILNPLSRTAHIRLWTVGTGGGAPKAISLGPGRVATYHARNSGAPAVGVVERSNIPVVLAFE